MNFTIVVNPTEPWLASDYDEGKLNGSEEMVVLFARQLASHHHNVSVYCSSKIDRYTDVSGPSIVNYWDRKYLQDHHHKGILIAFKMPSALLLAGFDKKFLWTADPDQLSPNQRKHCDGLVAISKWHYHELSRLNQGYNKIYNIEPGVVKMTPSTTERVAKQCLYASSPDRGLKMLLDIWPQVKAKHPDASLITTYSSGQRRSNQDMVDLYATSDILAYPCTGQERYCLTAIKAQMYGTIPCVIPHMALQDTVQYGVKSLKEDYAQSIIELLDDCDRREAIREEMVANVKYNTWEDVVDKWRDLIA